MANGLKVITAEDHANQIVCLQLYIKTGSAAEGSGQRGYSHFIEHLTFKATTSFPDNEISFLLPELGGSINAYTEFDTTCYYILIPSEHLAKGIEVLAELAFKAKFTSADVSLEKDIIIEEIKQYDNEPDSFFIEWIQKSYFQSNPLKYPVLGTVTSVRKATAPTLRYFYNSRYNPENSFLVITGDVDTNTVNSLVDQNFGCWQNEPNVIERDDTPAQSGFPESRLDKPLENNGFRLLTRTFTVENDYLAFVIPEITESHPLSDALLISARAFAAGKHCRLFKRLVENDKTAHGIRLHSISGFNPGIAIIQILPVDFEHLPDIIYAIHDEWQKLITHGLTTEETELAKLELYHSWIYDFEYIETMANALACDELTSNYTDLYTYSDRLNLLTPEQIDSCLQIYWDADYFAVYHMGKNRLNTSIQTNIRNLFAQQKLAKDKDIPRVEIPDIPILEFVPFSRKLISKDQSGDFYSGHLDCGMQVILKRELNKPIIGMAMTSPMCQLAEPLTQRGINHFTANLLIYGTQKRNFEQLQTNAIRKGYSLKVNQALETTTFKSKCFPLYLNEMLELSADILNHPAFPVKYLNLIKANSIDYIKREKESPFSNAFNNWVELIFGKDTNLHRSFGNIKQIKSIKREQLVQWHRDWYQPGNFTLCMTGDFDFNQALDSANRFFYTQPAPLQQDSSGCSPIRHHYHYSFPDKREKRVNSGLDQANVIIGGKGCSAVDRESNTAFYVLAQILGGELSSRFYNILREQYGYAYQAGFDFTSTQETGFWICYALCNSADYQKVISLIKGILADICTHGVSPEELASGQNYMLGMQRFDAESLSWQANTLSVLYASGYDYDYFLQREKRIKGVTLEQIRALANQWLTPDNFYSYIEI